VTNLVTDVNLVNNLWIIVCGLLVFSMTISVGLLEVGEVGESHSKSLLKTIIITGSALFFMAFLGFNPGSVLAFNSSAMTVVLTTFLAAASSLLSVMLFRHIATRTNPDLIYANNGILMGLIVITPIAGFVSPASAVILGLVAGPLYLATERWFSGRKWFTDPIGLFPGHLVGGIFGLLMIGFFTQNAFAAASGNGTLPNGLLFGGGLNAVHQLGLKAFSVVVVTTAVFLMSYAALEAIAWAMHGITTDYKKEGLTTQ
jgi:Amt family ammonium transporter